MTADDLLNGYMRILVKVAVLHPAEFIVISFEQQQATSG
jgi:phage tail sheath protein FI